ncbi:MAG: phosphate propanoyltransferase [bacterium]
MKKNKSISVPIEASARHIHLCQHAIDKLFGKNYQLTPLRQLSQPHEFACKETLKIKSKMGEFDNVRILGPVREYCQVEISATDARRLDLNPPVHESGDADHTLGITVIGPKGTVKLKRGVILAWRHIHASTDQAEKYNLKHGEMVSVKIAGPRELIFANVEIKVNDAFDWHMHIDTDEANACGLNSENNTGQVLL